MNKSFLQNRMAVFGAYCVFMAVVLAYGAFAEDPFRDLMDEMNRRAERMKSIEEFDPNDPEHLRKKRCKQSCSRIDDCGLLTDRELCMPWCEDEWTVRIQDCIAAADCDRIEELCFIESEEESCAELCIELMACPWMDMEPEECVETCVGEWTKTQRECLRKADCEKAPDHCVDLHPSTDCTQVCDKLESCGFSVSDGALDCVDYCEDGMDDPAKDCVLRQECDDIESQCALEELPSELCLLACDAAVVCELTTADEDDCYILCEEEWDLEIALCLAGQEICDDAEKCMDIAGSQCIDVCLRLIECAALNDWEYDLCIENCPIEFSDAERQCMLASPCVDLDGCLEAKGALEEDVTNECASCCAKMSECGLIDAQAQLDCQQTCIEGWSQLKRNCVLQSECPAIADQCLAQDSEEEP